MWEGICAATADEAFEKIGRLRFARCGTMLHSHNGKIRSPLLVIVTPILALESSGQAILPEVQLYLRCMRQGSNVVNCHYRCTANLSLIVKQKVMDFVRCQDQPFSLLSMVRSCSNLLLRSV